MFFLVLSIGGLLAFANGANDNFKGVATLFGSRTSSYRSALVWATFTTLLGSLSALILAEGLLVTFSGKGLVPAEVLANSAFPLAVVLAAGLTVLLATRLGFPISTTHALIGALVGAGLLASPQGINGHQLAGGFLAPLLVSPFLAVLGTTSLYPLLHHLRERLGISYETCLCIGSEVVGVVPGVAGPAQALEALRMPTLAVGTEASCRIRYQGVVMGVSVRRWLDVAHYLSAGAVSFARGLNDTPKIAALLLLGNLLAPQGALVAVGLVMAFGGLLSARRVAQTMSQRVTAMNPGPGLAANLVTSLLVLGASRFGMPVSTTHVSCGSLFGIGAVTREARWGMIGHIFLAWILTLPLAAILGAFAWAVLQRTL